MPKAGQPLRAKSRQGLNQATLCRSNGKDIENTMESLGRILKRIT